MNGINDFILKQIVFDFIKNLLDDIIMPFLSLFIDSKKLETYTLEITNNSIKIGKMINNLIYYSIIFIIISYVI